MIKTILGGILLQILNMQAIYHLNKNAHFGNTNNFYRLKGRNDDYSTKYDLTVE